MSRDLPSYARAAKPSEIRREKRNTNKKGSLLNPEVPPYARKAKGIDMSSQGNVTEDVFTDHDPGEDIKDVLDVLDIPGAATRSVVSGQGGKFLRDVAKGGLRAVHEAPTGTEVLDTWGVTDPESDSFAKQAGGFAAEMVLDPTAILGVGKKLVTGGLKAVGATGKLTKQATRNALKNPIRKQTLKALAGIKPTSGAMTKRGFDAEGIASTMYHQDVSKYIGNPKRLLEVLDGKKVLKETPAAGSFTSKTIRSPQDEGLIKNISHDLGSAIKEAQGGKPTMIGESDLSGPSFNKFIKELDDPTSGIAYTNKELHQISSLVRRHVKKESYTIDELYQLKKNLGSELDSKDFFATKELNLEKEAILSIQRRADEIIKRELQNKMVQSGDQMVNAGEYYALQNNRMHHLIQLRDVLVDPVNKGVKKPGLIAGALGMGTSGAVGLSTGFAAQQIAPALTHAPIVGGLVGVGTAVTRQSGKAVREGFAPAAVSAMEAIPAAAEMGTKALPYAPQMQRSMRDTKEERRENRRRFGGASQGIAAELINTKLPRNVEGLMENKKIVLAKIAQQAPQFFEEAKFIMNDRPEDLETLLPMLARVMPHAFENDKYGRINHKILDPNLQRKAREDIMEDGNLSNTQRIQMINKLNRTNILEDY